MAMTEISGPDAVTADEQVTEAVTGGASATTDHTVEPVVDAVRAEPPASAMAAPESTGASWAVGEWLGKALVDCDGVRIGKLRDVYVDVGNDAPMFGTVREGVFARHLTFVPLVGVQIRPDALQVTATKDRVRSAPDIEMHGDELSQADESALYHHFEQNYTPIDSTSGRRLARR
jgi:hypothetical protein